MKNKTALRILGISAFVACFAECRAGIVGEIGPSFGQCYPKDAVKQFDPRRYSGRWYGVQAFNAAPWYYGDYCYQENLNLTGENFEVHEAMFEHRYPKKRISRHIFGLAKINATGHGILAVSLPKVNRTRTDYILSTDYGRYSIVYSCTNYDRVYFDALWVLSREPKLSISEEKVNRHAGKCGFNPSAVMKIKQDCGAINIEK